MRALMGEEGDAYQSFVFPALGPTKTLRHCDLQLDWPKVDGTLRDSTPVFGDWSRASEPAAKNCHILDRFRPFRYRYGADTVLKATAMNTVRHGVCQTSRVVSLQNDTLPTALLYVIKDDNKLLLLLLLLSG